jgi:hypothetical protein
MVYRADVEAADLIEERIRSYRLGQIHGPLRGEAILDDCLRIRDAPHVRDRIAKVRAEGFGSLKR